MKKIRLAYGRVFQQWFEKGYTKEVELDTEQVRHVLAHFPIVKDSLTTPVRPVMDCKVALNEHLLAGPNLLNEVPAVLLRFRSGLVAFSGDVTQMFLQIQLLPQDRPYHCFLWQEGDGPLRVYQFQVHVFGNAGSPFLAVYVVKEHAKKYQHKFPQASDTLQHSTLIDDVLDSVDSIKEAEQVLKQVRTILQEAGMQLVKLHSNQGRILRSFPPEVVRAGCVDVAAACTKPEQNSTLKALGICYNPSADQFYFDVSIDPPKLWTKREVIEDFPSPV